jgi:diguanylate cyclase (GGDEF)-like protein/PAS domain S-box-containing protein
VNGKPVKVIACSVFKAELSALSDRDIMPFPIRFFDSIFHMRPDELHDELMDIIKEEQSSGFRILLLCGDCSARMTEMVTDRETVRVAAANCGEMLLGKQYHKSLVKKGAFLLFPEWMERWREVLFNFPGMDTELSIMMLRDLHTCFVYLNTGVRPVPHDELKACSAFFGLPYEVLDIGLDHLEKVVSEAIDRIPGLQQAGTPVLYQRSATAIMMLDIITTVLGNPGNTPEMALQLSQKIRELTGSRIVILVTVIEYDGWLKNRILAVAPSRHAALAETEPVRDMIEQALQMDHATVIPLPAQNEQEKDLSTDVNMFPCLIMPLKIAGERVGAILSLGLLDSSFVDSILEIESILSNVVSVVLKNALLQEKQQKILRNLEREIEERKIAEKKLSESEQRKRSLIETTSDWIWEIDNNACYTYSSPQVEDLLGYTPIEILGRKPFDFMLPNEAKKAKERFYDILASHAPISGFEYRRRRKDGREVTLETNGESFFDANNVFSGYRGITRDVTRRKQAEDLLALERQRLTNILEGTNVGTWEWNIQTGETVFNERWAEMLGYTLSELMPVSINTWTKYAHTDDVEISKELLSRHFKKEIPYYECEARMLHRDGSWIWVLDRGKVATWTDDGQALMMFGTHQDITGRKLAEDRIKYMATHDILTDLPNTKLAMDRLSMALGLARRHKKMAAVMFIDLDGFKKINDFMGHDTGDCVLKQTAQRMVSCVRETDTVARYGGDEFLVIATGLKSADGAAEIARKMIALISRPIICEDRTALIGASIGIALFPTHSSDIDQLIKLADEAMYKVKNRGKNGFAFAETPQKNQPPLEGKE